MGCGGRKKNFEFRQEQKWDYISLNDFKSSSCFTPFAYGYLYFSIIISIAVYSVDTFTAINLLAFDKWSSEIKPALDQKYSKWIFSVCIILSFVNLGYEHFRAQRIMKRGNVAECYLDSLAARLESMRPGKGQGWKRFLVFAELTKSKKGAEYVALFTYFSFQSWIRVILCSGPRQVVNALTLWGVYQAKLAASGDNVGNTLLDFFDKIKILAESNYMQATILSGMLFTLVVWVFSALSLLLGILFFVFFLWSYIPRDDGGLTAFCSRKINKRLTAIVTQKVNKALAKQEQKKRKAGLKAARKAGELPPQDLKPSLPDLGSDMLPEMPMMNRNDTTTTLPVYSSRPVSPGGFEMGSLDQKRPMPSRTGTMASSASSYSTSAPLLNHAAQIGMSRSESPAPSLPQMPDLSAYPPSRVGTVASSRPYGAPQLGRMNTNGSGFRAEYTASPAPYSSNDNMHGIQQPFRPPPSEYGRPLMPNHMSGRSTPASRPPQPDHYPQGGRASPAPSAHSYRPGPMSPSQTRFPVRSATGPMPPRGPPRYPPTRNMTAPNHQRYPSNTSSSTYQTHLSGGSGHDYFERPSTANSQQSSRPGFGNGWGADLEGQRGPRY